jgi:lysozyme family protein
MAKFENFVDRLLVLEGGFAILKNDKGGATKYGVTLQTWKEFGHDKDGDGDIDVEDIKLLTPEDAKSRAKKIFWDYFKADQIKNQSIAEFICDWGYNSGRTTIAKKVQTLLGLKTDGIFGSQTLTRINTINQEQLFNLLKLSRMDFVKKIVERDPTQERFYNGWVNRIQKFFFKQGDNPNQ